MSSPYPSQTNPDTRLLPDGWISQYDPNYRTWYYVNTKATPPVTSWTHPLGAPPPAPPPPPPHAPPVGPPPPGNNSGVGGFAFPTPVGGGYNANPYGYENPQGSYAAGYQGNGGGPLAYGGNTAYPQQQVQTPGAYTGYPQQQQQQQQQQHQGSSKGVGGLLGGLFGGKAGGGGLAGKFGAGGGYAGQNAGYPQQVMYGQQQQPPKKSGMGGAGMMAAGAGVGLLGGLLVADVIDHSLDDERRDEYYDDYGGGDYDDFGGGDF